MYCDESRMLHEEIEEAIYNSILNSMKIFFEDEEFEILKTKLSCRFDKSWTEPYSFHFYFLDDNDRIISRLPSMLYDQFITRSGFFITRFSINSENINSYTTLPKECIDELTKFIESSKCV